MTELDPLIHQPTRLRIMAALVSLDQGEKADFTFLRDLLELTDGNRAILIKALPQDYAFYIAQRLDADLQADADEAAVNLSDDAGQVDASEGELLSVEVLGANGDAIEM